MNAGAGGGGHGLEEGCLTVRHFVCLGWSGDSGTRARMSIEKTQFVEVLFRGLSRLLVAG